MLAKCGWRASKKSTASISKFIPSVDIVTYTLADLTQLKQLGKVDNVILTGSIIPLIKISRQLCKNA